MPTALSIFTIGASPYKFRRSFDSKMIQTLSEYDMFAQKHEGLGSIGLFYNNVDLAIGEGV